MNLLRCVSCFLLLLATTAWAAPPTVGGRDFEQWVSFYYVHPAPEEIAEALRIVDSEGYFQNDNVQAPLSGFFAEVFRANPERISGWVAPYAGRKSMHILYSALWVADSSQSRAALALLQTIANPADRLLIESLLVGGPPSIGDTTVDSPAVLDYLWGRFMASGAEEPVIRVIQEMQSASPGSGTTQMLISGAANWSVSANARQHIRVLEIVKAQAQAQPSSEVASALRQIIDNAPPTGPSPHGG